MFCVGHTVGQSTRLFPRTYCICLRQTSAYLCLLSKPKRCVSPLTLSQWHPFYSTWAKDSLPNQINILPDIYKHYGVCLKWSIFHVESYTLFANTQSLHILILDLLFKAWQDSFALNIHLKAHNVFHWLWKDSTQVSKYNKVHFRIIPIIFTSRDSCALSLHFLPLGVTLVA